MYYHFIRYMPYIHFYTLYIGDIYSMHKLIYEDIRDSTIKQDILNYIKLQANIQHGHDMIRSRKGQNYECVVCVILIYTYHPLPYTIHTHILYPIYIGKKRIKLAWKKILSDVDDTLLCSGGSYPAGIDTSYPKKAVYPGEFISVYCGVCVYRVLSVLLCEMYAV